MSGLKSALRWLAILPASLLAGTLVLFPIHWLAQIYRVLPDFGDSVISDKTGRSIFKTMQLQDLERLGQALIVPAAMILVAAYVAPRARFTVSVIMALFLVTLAAGSYFFLAASPGIEFTFGAIPGWVMVALWTISIAGALFKAYVDSADSNV